MRIKKYTTFVSIHSFDIIAGLLVIAGLTITRLHGYQLFDILSEIFVAFVAFATFTLVWNARRYFENDFFPVLGVSLLFVGGLSLAHIFLHQTVSPASASPFLAWVSSRILLAIGLLAAIGFLHRRVNMAFVWLGNLLFFITGTAVALLWNPFPGVAFGNYPWTIFESITETGIAFLCLIGFLLLYQERAAFSAPIRRQLLWSVAIATAAEICMASTTSRLALSETIGHSLKIVAFYLIYKAVVERGFREPHELIFRALNLREQELKQERDRLGNYLDISSDIVVLVGADHRVQLINRQGGRVLGNVPDKIVSKNWFELFLPERIRSAALQQFSESLAGQPTCTDAESPVIAGDGKERIISWHSCAIQNAEGETIAILLSGNDITERVADRDRIKHLSSFPELNPRPICEIDLTGKVNYINPAARKLFPDLEMKGITHPWCHEITESTVAAFRNDGIAFLTRELQINDRIYEQFITHVPQGSLIRIYGSDITERKESEKTIQNQYEELHAANEELSASNQELLATEEELRAVNQELSDAEEQLKAAQRIAHIGSWQLDLKTNKLDWSDEVFRIFEIDKQQFGASYDAFLNAIHPDDRTKVDEAYTRSLKDKQPYEIVHRLRFPDGRIKYIHERCETVFDSSGAPLVSTGSVQDITEIKLAEQALREAHDDMEKKVQERTAELMKAAQSLEAARRLSDIGTLAATVAHELRNPLAAIRMAVYNIRRKAETTVLDKHLTTIDKKVADSDQIINNLLLYSRTRTADPQLVNMTTLLDETIEGIANRHSKRKVSFIKSYQKLPGMMIDADPLLVKELFENLLDNAVDAVADESGTIEISAKNNNDHYNIQVKDNGIGINPEQMAQLFDPFFSTKSKGTGLGLAVCKQIVGVHNGDISIASTPGDGTTITVKLPYHKTT